MISSWPDSHVERNGPPTDVAPKPPEPFPVSWRLLALLGVAAVLVVILMIPLDERATLATGLLPILGWILLGAMAIAIIALGVRLGLGGSAKQAPPPLANRVPADGPGKFRISGVDRASKLDTVWHCAADSEANARAKGELEGILVTRVVRVD